MNRRPTWADECSDAVMQDDRPVGADLIEAIFSEFCWIPTMKKGPTRKASGPLVKQQVCCEMNWSKHNS